MTGFESICRKCILRLTPYVPGKPIEEVKRDLGLSDVIKLASNENPLGPSPKAIEAMKNLAARVGLYPEGSCFELRHSLAKFLDVAPEMLTFGAGADEVIRYIGVALLEDADEVVMAKTTFSQYEAATTVMDCPGHYVPLKDFTYDLDAMLEKVNQRTKLFFITNPNNPTGTILGSAAVQRVLDRLPERCLVVLDEAYYEYADDLNYTRSLDWVREGRNVVLLRTFSKIYALAGLRVGYGVAPAGIVDLIERVRLPFNVSSMAQAAAVASLSDPDQVSRSREQNSRSKKYFYRELDAMGITYTPTQANFLWICTGRDCKTVFAELLKRGVIVRTGDIFGCPEHIRVTTGTDEENVRFIKALREVLAL